MLQAYYYASSRNQNASSPTAFTTYSQKLEGSSWYLDKGASNHVAFKLQKLTLEGKNSGEKTIVAGDGTKLPIVGLGTTYLRSKGILVILKDILYVPS